MILACFDLAAHFHVAPSTFLDMDERELAATFHYTQESIDRRARQREESGR